MSIFALNAQTLEENMNAAEAAFSEGNMTLALEHYNKAIPQIAEPTGYSTMFAYAGICAKELGKVDQAKKYFIASVFCLFVLTVLFYFMKNSHHYNQKEVWGEGASLLYSCKLFVCF